jgi:hypothetical protein
MDYFPMIEHRPLVPVDFVTFRARPVFRTIGWSCF